MCQTLLLILGSEAHLIRQDLFENPNREMSDAKSKVHCTHGVINENTSKVDIRFVDVSALIVSNHFLIECWNQKRYGNERRKLGF